MLYINAIISMLSELGLYLCFLIGLFMIDTKLGLTALGLYVINYIANHLIMKEIEKKPNE